MISLASDVGGTFTDVVLTGADGRTHVVKTLTTPDDPTVGLLRAVVQVLAAAEIAPAKVGRFVHASTLAANVILELFAGGRNIIPQVEPIEARLPVRVDEVSLIPDSGGAGRHRGGLGTRTVLRMLEDARVDTRGDRLRRPPPGAAGGEPGRAGGYYREQVAGGREPLAAKATRQPLTAGEALVVETSGGGYGDPSERATDARRADLADGRISGAGE
jgi:hydantoinase/oxoprolinase-like protein